MGAIRFYQVTVSSWTPPSCRYNPSCSAYALEAVRIHGSARGSWLALRRFLSCHPWGGHGYDPVPPARRAGGAEMPEHPVERTTTGGPEGRAASSDL